MQSDKAEVPSLLHKSFTLSLHQLARFRIGLSLWFLLDLYFRLTDARMLYSELGVLSRSWLGFLELAEWPHSPFLSVYTLADSPAAVTFLLLCQGIAFVLLGLGWKTKWVGPLAWILLWSLHQRNPLVLYGADHLLRCLLLWGCLTPWGERLSLDSDTNDSEDCSLLHPVGAIMILQIVLMVTVAGWEKTQAEWTSWSEASAILTAIGAVSYETACGQFLAQFLQDKKSLVALITSLVLIWERGFVLLFFLSRRAASLSLLAFGLILGLVLSIGLWPLCLVVVSLLIWPAGPKSFKNSEFGPRLTGLALTIALLSFSYSLGLRPKLLPQTLGRIGLCNKWELFALLPHQDGWPEVVLTSTQGKTHSYFGEWEGERPKSVPYYTRNIRWRRHFLKLFLQQKFQRYLANLSDAIRRETIDKGHLDDVAIVEVWWNHRAHRAYSQGEFVRQSKWRDEIAP